MNAHEAAANKTPENLPPKRLSPAQPSAAVDIKAARRAHTTAVPGGSPQASLEKPT
jgi:hypothetical protein